MLTPNKSLLSNLSGSKEFACHDKLQSLLMCFLSNVHETDEWLLFMNKKTFSWKMKRFVLLGYLYNEAYVIENSVQVTVPTIDRACYHMSFVDQNIVALE